MVISKRANIKTSIKSCFLYVEEIKLSDEDQIKYLKFLNDGYIKSINFLENPTRIFDEKLSTVNENFYINNYINININNYTNIKLSYYNEYKSYFRHGNIG